MANDKNAPLPSRPSRNNDAKEAILNSAPVAAQPQTQAPKTVEVEEEVVEVQQKATEATNFLNDAAPWRKKTTMSEEELMLATKKFSANLPMELFLRLNFIVAIEQLNSPKKVDMTQIVTKALMESTEKTLKKMGYKV
ncbi:hypothetical protein ACN1NW_000496 [Acinetobacter baumannii]|nr:hypothetical protein [Acinetobacter baumannii]ELA7031078.1 hypothetical protein [Acinetobacter baumannii]ELA7118841.1 hypothetical protein [Acinetobacter baumannii]ELB0919791.1 hypothetical protein [Acinetobacter baumannii]ELB0965968.1 hypothetical protein [Acinetobacter baumannii]